MPASSKASSACNHSSLLPLLPGFLLPSGCPGGCCQCQLLASSLATTWVCRNPGSVRGTWACTVRAWQRFQSVVQKCTPVSGHAADTTTAANAIAWHSSKVPGKAMQDQAKAPFLVGKEKPKNVDLSKGKSVEEISWKWPFHKILECTCSSKNLSESLQTILIPHSPHLPCSLICVI